MPFITATEAAHLIQDDWCVVPGGFGCCGHPEALTAALGERYRTTGSPRRLKLLFAAGSGDRAGRGLDHLAQPGLVSSAIGGFWGFVPRLGALALSGAIEAHNWPQGVVSQLFRATAARLPGILSRVGLGTFIDPEQDGGRLNDVTPAPLMRRMDVNGETFLFYPTQRIDCALIRGTRADAHGNIAVDEEISFQDSLAQAQAARNSGGIVIAQVKSRVPGGALKPHDIKVPGALVDYIVVADDDLHPQTYAETFNPAYVTAGLAAPSAPDTAVVREIIARRAVEELAQAPGAIVNVGIGIPAEIGGFAHLEGIRDYTLTVESGQFGGIPASGLSFGAARHPQAVIEQSHLFDFYDGGGLDLAFLGFAQVDSTGSVNVSHFPGRVPGIGGFANISRAAKRVVFCGSLTAGGLDVAVHDGRLSIRREGRHRKFLRSVPKISFNGPLASKAGQSVLYITERAVFRLDRGCLRLEEIAPGVDLERDVIDRIESAVIVSSNLKLMKLADSRRAA